MHTSGDDCRSDRLDAALALAFGTPPAAGSGSEPLPQLPDRYRLLGEVGRGGIGLVLRAHDLMLVRDVAIKVLRARHAVNAAMARRFFDEAQVIAQMQHPGIVPVHEVGILANGQPWFAMRLVDGESLEQRLQRRQPEDLPALLASYERLVETLAYAHARGVLHRDLKPANVMLGAFGEVLVLDWGMTRVQQVDGAQPIAVASLRTGEDDGSLPGSVLGTPGYMAPEQARGEVDRIDARTDVFGLGAILCRILTGLPACSGGDTEALRAQAARGDFRQALVALAASGSEPALVDLARECLAAAPEQRPADAEAIADRLQLIGRARQQRARMAEVALARTAAERRARRFGLALGLALLGLVAVVVLRQFEVERTRAAAEFAALEALVGIAPLQQAAERSGSIEGWQIAVTAARLAVLTADQGPTSAAVRRRAQQVLQDAEAGAATAATAAARRLRDTDLRHRLDAARGLGPKVLDWASVVAVYEAIFADHGIDPAADTLALRARLDQAGLTRSVAAALDDCAAARFRLHGRTDPHRRAWRDLADTLEPDHHRAALRAIDPGDPERLMRFVADADASGFDAPTATLLADRLTRVDRRKDARELLLQAQLRHPDDFWLAFELAWNFWGDSPPQLASAAHWFSVCTALRPDSAPAFANLGTVLATDGQVARGVAALRRATQLAPEQVLTWLNLGVALRQMGDDAAAATAFEAALQRTPDDPQVACLLANSLTQVGEVGAAQQVYETTLLLCPDSVELRLGLGSLLCDRLGHLTAAEMEFRRCLELAPDAIAPRLNLAMVAKRRNDGAVMRDWLQSVLLVDPALPEAHLELARLDLQEQRFADASAHAQACLAARPQQAIAAIFLAHAERSQGRTAAAMAAFERALVLRPDDADLRSELLTALLEHARATWLSGDLPAALAAARRIADLDPTPDARCRVAIVLHASGAFAAAASTFAAAGNLREEQALAIFADALLETGRWSEAGEMLSRIAAPTADVAAFVASRTELLAQIERQRAAGFDPERVPLQDEPLANTALARLYLADGKPAAAARCFAAAVQASPQRDPNLLFTAAVALVEAVVAEPATSGELIRARQWLQQALGLTAAGGRSGPVTREQRIAAHRCLLDERLQPVREPDGAFRGGFEPFWREVQALVAAP